MSATRSTESSPHFLERIPLSEFLIAAQRYARLGFPVFPLGEKSKRPKIAGGCGCKDATTNEAQITTWWTQWPEANIGIHCTSFWVLDVDTAHGGDDTIQALEHKHGKLPDTLQQVTGNGGRHYLFANTIGTVIPNSVATLGAGLDTRSVGGYIAAEPSIHPDTGRTYTFDGMAEIEDQQILPAPAWLITLLTEKKKIQESAPLADIIPKGQQHSTLVSKAGAMRRAGLNAKEMFPALWEMNVGGCEIPGPEGDIRRIAESAEASWAAGKLISGKQTRDLSGVLSREFSRNTQSTSNGFDAERNEVESATLYDLDNLPCIALTEFPPVNYVVETLIPTGSFGMLSGESGSGKSTVAIAIADAIANGKPWLGLKTEKRHVLYKDRENNILTLASRLKRMGIVDDGYLKIWSNWAKEVNVYEHSLDSEVLLKYVEKHENPVIIADSLVSFLPPGASENDATHIREFMNLARKLTARGATVIFIHHTGKSEGSKKFRGSSDIQASVDFAYLVTSELDEKRYLDTVKLECFKMRDEVLAELPMLYRNGNFIRPEASEGFKAPAHYKTLMDLLMEFGGICTEKLETKAKEKGVSRTKVREFLKNDSLVITVPADGRTKGHYWHSDPMGPRKLSEEEDSEAA